MQKHLTYKRQRLPDVISIAKTIFFGIKCPKVNSGMLWCFSAGLFKSEASRYLISTFNQQLRAKI
jgi:hypothetical protein